MIIVLILLILIGVWIYSDATARGDPQPGLWAVAAVLFSIVVVPVWLMKRGPKIATAPTEPQRKCPHCAEWIKREATVCKHCHRDIPPRVLPPRVLKAS